MIDFVLLCREKHIPYLEGGHHHAHDGWVQIHCPFCASGTHGWHMGWNLEAGYFNCWRCGKHSTKKVLRAYLKNENIGMALERYKLFGRRARPGKEKVRRKKTKAPPSLMPLKAVHKRYLRMRGYNPTKLAELWDLSATGAGVGDWSWRIVAPVRNIRSEIVAYTGRAVNKNKKPKWRTTENEHMAEDPNKLLYGVHHAEDAVLVVEGPSDVWRMGRGAVALLGIDWAVEQAALLRRYKRRYILFDPEPEAQKRARKLASWIAPFPGETELLYDIETDPGSLPQTEADSIMRELNLR